MALVQPGTPALQLVGSVDNPVTKQNPDGQLATLILDRYGSMIVSELRGKYAAASKRGNVFVAGTVIAGVALPVNAATLVSKWTLWNPAGSGKDVELIEVSFGLTSATEVVDGIAMGYQAPVSTGGGSPTSLTLADGISSTYLGQGLANVAKPYKAATLTNAAVLPVYPLGMNFDATAAGRSGNFVYNFDGKIILPPDTLVTFLTNVAAETAMTAGMVWAEWPQ